MRNPEGCRQLLAPEPRAVAGSADLEIFGEARRDARDHVRDERPGQTVKRAIHLRVVRALHRDLSVLTIDLHVPVERPRQLAFRALHAHGLAVDLDIDPAWDRDRESTDSAHDALPDLINLSAFADETRS